MFSILSSFPLVFSAERLTITGTPLAVVSTP